MNEVGIFGGIFDPIHFGHLQVAEAAGKVLELSNLIFVPSGLPPHKKPPIASCQDRLNMLEMAIEKSPYFSISKIEIERKEYSYTKDTVEKLKAIYKETEFYFVIGSDTISELSEWKEIDRLFREIRFVAVTRQGFPIKDANSNIQIITSPTLAISSSEIRRRVKEGGSIKYLVPERVEEYIYENGLYK
ncbi:MAG: nicotinate-nucleotide adenylyltransferase [bacterium]|nr:nicotinate-nucleotide adenylyltransferase [bacterium]